MKILRKNDDFKKVSEKTSSDRMLVNNLLNQGWTYCAKRTYKDFGKTEDKKIEKIEKTEADNIITKSGKRKIK